jgi:hypothetical protein
MVDFVEFTQIALHDADPTRLYERTDHGALASGHRESREDSPTSIYNPEREKGEDIQ